MDKNLSLKTHYKNPHRCRKGLHSQVFLHQNEVPKYLE